MSSAREDVLKDLEEKGKMIRAKIEELMRSVNELGESVERVRKELEKMSGEGK